MAAARLVKKLADARQGFNNGLIGGNFAIKHAQRIGYRATLAVSAHLPDDGRERLAQSFVVGCTIIWTAYRVQLQRPVLDANAVEQRGQQLQNFGIPSRRL